jgi:hypothetical protein
LREKFTFEFLGEQPFSADFGQRLIENSIAQRRDNFFLTDQGGMRLL